MSEPSWRRPADEYRWGAAAQEHQLALMAFVEEARRLDPDTWLRPRQPEKWSPAQIAEHLALAYEMMLRELGGQGSPVVRVGPWQERVLRWFLLPHILYHRHFPLSARAPRETRPGEAAHEAEAGLDRLVELGQRFEDRLLAAWRGGGGRLTHPYFGQLPPIRALRLCAVHLDHHRQQLPRASRVAPLP